MFGNDKDLENRIEGAQNPAYESLLGDSDGGIEIDATQISSLPVELQAGEISF